MSQEIMEGIRTIEREKGIETGTLVAALEDALLAAYKKTPGASRHAEVILDDEGEFRVFSIEIPADLEERLVEEALRIFFEVREVPGLKKKPSTSELLDWLKLLLNEDITPEMLRERDPRKLIPPLHGALLKNEQDVHLFERLAFLSRREV